MDYNFRSHKHGKKQTTHFKRHEDDPEFPKRQIADNTKRNLSSSDSDDSAPDFDYLLRLPPSTGAHFLLKSEQLKYQQEVDAEFSKNFTIDTALLNMALKSIPFNERHEFNSFTWKSDELRNMQDESAIYEGKYRDMLENAFVNNSKADKSEKPKPVPNVNKEKDEQKPDSNSNNQKESIQKWLDDILDL